MNAQRQYIEACSLLAGSKFKLNLELVGTQFIFNDGADYDLLWLVSDRAAATLQLLAEDYSASVGDAYDLSSGKFKSFVKGKINVLITDNQVFFDRFVVAAHVCKYMQVKDKETRKSIHRIVRDGAEWDEVPVAVMA